MLTALIAVGGTLLGSIVTFGFQRITADRNVRQGFFERLRQDRLSAYSAFAAAAMEYRHFENERWHRMQIDPDTQAATAAAAHAQRAGARTELLRIKLLSSDVQLQKLGHHAIESARAIYHAETREDHDERLVQATAAIDAFVAHAAVDVQRLPTLRSKTALYALSQLPPAEATGRQRTP